MSTGELPEVVQYSSMFDSVAVSGSLEDRVIECVDHLHEHFLDPVWFAAGVACPDSSRLGRTHASPDPHRMQLPGGRGGRPR